MVDNASLAPPIIRDSPPLPPRFVFSFLSFLGKYFSFSLWIAFAALSAWRIALSALFSAFSLA